jgi:small conductance mechanosensitive channel
VYYSAEEALRNFFNRFDLAVWLGVAAVLIGACVLVRAGNAAIARLFNPGEGSTLTGGRRAQTMAALLKSILRYAVYFIAGITILGQLGVQTGALLTGAGLVGLAAGFGAKNLVQDIITGFFILFEDQFDVGDYISAAGVAGVVEEVGLRVTRLKDMGGQVHFLPNGSISQVTNYSRGSLQAVVDIGISYTEDLDRAMEVMKQAGAELARDRASLITTVPEVLGVVALKPGEATVRISAGVRPLHHWKVERELRKRVKEALDKAGVKPPG